MSSSDHIQILVWQQIGNNYTLRWTTPNGPPEVVTVVALTTSLNPSTFVPRAYIALSAPNAANPNGVPHILASDSYRKVVAFTRLGPSNWIKTNVYESAPCSVYCKVTPAGIVVNTGGDPRYLVSSTSQSGYHISGAIQLFWPTGPATVDSQMLAAEPFATGTVRLDPAGRIHLFGAGYEGHWWSTWQYDWHYLRLSP